jgi:hypothetical protein
VHRINALQLVGRVAFKAQQLLRKGIYCFFCKLLIQIYTNSLFLLYISTGDITIDNVFDCHLTVEFVEAAKAHTVYAIVRNYCDTLSKGVYSATTL